MVPHNIREGDFVEVSNKGSQYFGLIGKVRKIRPSHLTVDIYGKLVDIKRDELTLKARVGSRTHDELSDQVQLQEPKDIDEAGYNDLINYALDLKDFEWAVDLVHRKNNYLKNRKKVKG